LWFAAFRILLPDALTQNLRVASDTYTFMSLDPSSQWRKLLNGSNEQIVDTDEQVFGREQSN